MAGCKRGLRVGRSGWHGPCPGSGPYETCKRSFPLYGDDAAQYNELRSSMTGGTAMKVSCAATCTCTLIAAVLNYGMVSATESKGGGEASFSEKVGEGARKIGDAIARGFKKTAKKLEDKHVPEKVEQKFKKAADKTAEGIGKADRKIKEKLAD